MRDAVHVERRRPGRERLGRRDPLPRRRGPGHRPLDDRPDRLARHAVERVGHRLLGQLHHGLDLAAVDGDVHQDRRDVVVVVPQIVMHGLEVPDHLAGLGADTDDAVRIEVVAGPVSAVHVVAGSPGRQVDEPELLVGAHHRPDVGHPRVFPRVIQPGLDAGLPCARNRIPGPAQRARTHVVGAHIPRSVLHGQRMVRHRLADHHDVTRHQRRRGIAVVDELGRVGEHPQVDHPPVAEALDQLAGLEVRRQQIRGPHREDASIRPAVVLPEPDPAVRGAAGGLAVGQERQVLHPAGLAGRRVERLDHADAVRGIEHPVHHQGGRAEVVRVPQRVPPVVETAVDRGPPPDDLQIVHRVGVDLVERRVPGESAVTAVDTPLAAGPLLRGGRSRQTRRRSTPLPAQTVSRLCASPSVQVPLYRVPETRPYFRPSTRWARASWRRSCRPACDHPSARPPR